MVEDTQARSRLLNNLKYFTTDGCHSKVVQQLIAAEPEDSKAIAMMNSREMTTEELAAVEEAVKMSSQMHHLNDSQQKALLLSLTTHVSLVQGPPGTGKTSTSAAILDANNRLYENVSSSAPTNLGIDEVVIRLLEKNVDVLRYGDWHRIDKERIKTVSVEVKAEQDKRTMEYSRKSKAWWSKRKEIMKQMVEKEEAVHAGTLDSYGKGPFTDL